MGNQRDEKKILLRHARKKISLPLDGISYVAILINIFLPIIIMFVKNSQYLLAFAMVSVIVPFIINLLNFHLTRRIITEGEKNISARIMLALCISVGISLISCLAATLTAKIIGGGAIKTYDMFYDRYYEQRFEDALFLCVVIGQIFLIGAYLGIIVGTIVAVYNKKASSKKRNSKTKNT